MRHRVLIDSRMAASAGIGTYIVNLVPLLAKRMQDVVFTLLGRPALLASLGLLEPTNVTAFQYNRRLYGPAELLGPLRARPTDLLWVPHFNVPFTPFQKLLVTVHDTFHLAMPELMKNGLRARYARQRYHLVRARADRVITVSSFTRSEIVRHLGIDRNRVEVISLGVDSSWRCAAGGSRNTESPYIVFVGSLKPHKNVGTLIEAFQRIQHTVPHTLLIIGSDEGMLTRDEALLRSRQRLGERVRFLGHIEKADLIRSVRGADALVHPSLYEGFGLTPVEAMACGCPTVVSSAASLPEVCGDASVYFDPHSAADLADSLLRVLSNSRLREDLIAKGRTRADTYVWSTTADRTAAVIRSMLADGRGVSS